MLLLHVHMLHSKHVHFALFCVSMHCTINLQTPVPFSDGTKRQWTASTAHAAAPERLFHQPLPAPASASLPAFPAFWRALQQADEHAAACAPLAPLPPPGHMASGHTITKPTAELQVRVPTPPLVDTANSHKHRNTPALAHTNRQTQEECQRRPAQSRSSRRQPWQVRHQTWQNSQARPTW